MNDIDRLYEIFQAPARVAAWRCQDLARDFFVVRFLREQLANLDKGAIYPWKVDRREATIELSIVVKLPPNVAMPKPIVVGDARFEDEVLKAFTYDELPLDRTICRLGNSADGTGTGWAFKNRRVDAPLEIVIADRATVSDLPLDLGVRPPRIELPVRMGVLACWYPVG